MKPIVLRSLLALTSLATGACSTAPVRHPVNSIMRKNLGALAVVVDTNVPRIAVQVPDSREEIAAEKNGEEIVMPWHVASLMGPAVDEASALILGACAVASPVLVTLGAPIAQPLRRACGQLITEPAAQVETGRATIDGAVAQLDYPQRLRREVLKALAVSAPRVPVAASREQADTVLELFVYEPNISGREGLNPRIGLNLGLRVRLLHASSGEELYYDYLDYHGARHKFANWVANDARVFHEEIDRSIANLTAEIVAQFFTRKYHAIPERADLRAHGIARR